MAVRSCMRSRPVRARFSSIAACSPASKESNTCTIQPFLTHRFYPSGRYSLSSDFTLGERLRSLSVFESGLVGWRRHVNPASATPTLASRKNPREIRYARVPTAKVAVLPRSCIGAHVEAAQAFTDGEFGHNPRFAFGIIRGGAVLIVGLATTERVEQIVLP
jgi:hypothetical protein